MPASPYPCAPAAIVWNPTAAELRARVAAMPEARPTEFGNYNVSTKVLARSKASTYVITDTPQEHSDQTLTRAEGEAVAAKQNTFIAGEEMLVIDGYIGSHPTQRVATRLWMQARYANIAAMQQQLFFPVEKPQKSAGEAHGWAPTLQVVYTPGLPAPGFPSDRVIAVDLQRGITRVLNSDYFGESKKGGLRMWNKLIYDRGGLPMHAGCKVMPTGGQKDGVLKSALIIGLSGTGKTTTTFTRQQGSQPIQDDFIALMGDGGVLASENGCFAKTYGLDPGSEPIIHHAVTQKGAYLENVSQKNGPKLDFFDESYTQNGRATFGFDLVTELGDLNDIPPVGFILILNRNENIIPAVAKLSPAQAAAYFMLGETKGTSAGGAEEAGKALRVPGTNPFFPLLHANQGTRFLELMKRLSCEVYLMNTGWVGGPHGTPISRKVKIRHSSAVVQAIADGSIAWQFDEDFGYQVAHQIPGLGADDAPVLRPKDHYIANGCQAEYRALVDKLRTDRVIHLRKFPGLTAEILAAVGPPSRAARG